jgi:E3 ubiquitin-protein ligase HECTD2
MSHPFPSLFSGKKKRQGGTAEAIGFESTDDELMTPDVAGYTTPTSNTRLKVPDKDLTTGRCMTCDSMVRWPKDLKVFRCTVCMTINDLRPIALEARSGDGYRAPTQSKQGGLPGPGFMQASMLNSTICYAVD